MDLSGKTIDDLRLELELIDRTIAALEKLGRLRTEGTLKKSSLADRANTSIAVFAHPAKGLQTQ